MDILTPRDFTISSRQFDEDQEWFGLDANPSGAINVPSTDHYQPAEPQNVTSTTLRKVMNMSGETTITVIGNLTNDPELRFIGIRGGQLHRRLHPKEPSTGKATNGKTARHFSSGPPSGAKPRRTWQSP